MSIINTLRRNHLLLAALLFAVAATLYAVGLRSEAVVLLALGFVVELAAWVALLTDRTEGQFPPSAKG